MSFVRRKIDVEISLGTGDFGAGPAGAANSFTAKGLKVSAQIVKAGLPSADHAEIRVWGLTQSIMNKLTTLGKPLARARDNVITVKAGDDVTGMSQVFIGNIQTAYGDYTDPPNAALNITAITAGVIAAKPVPPLSFPGGGDVVTMMSQIAATMGKGFVNSGVSGVILVDQYLPGTAWDQMKALAAAANINADANDKTLEIWPKTGSRGGAVPKVGPQSGLVGYPEFCDAGVAIKAQYQPGFQWGGQFDLDTSITNARGLWNILKLTYDLESETPDGPWFVEMTATRPAASGGGP